MATAVSAWTFQRNRRARRRVPHTITQRPSPTRSMGASVGLMNR